MTKSNSMNKFECKICNYSTKYKKDFKKHNLTRKHIKQVSHDTNIDKNPICLHPTPTLLPPYTHQNLPFEEEYSENSHSENLYVHFKNSKSDNICKYCNRTFSRPDTLSKHLNSCKSKTSEESNLKTQIIELRNQLELFKTKNEHYIEETNHYKAETKHHLEETNYYKQLLREAGGLVKKSVSSLTYIVDNYSNAPALQTITMDEIKNMEDNEKKIVDEILSAYKHKTLGKYLGSFIIKIYKKNDPENQSIWNTDDSRLTYLIKELLSNKSSNWIIDKKGIKTKEYLIDPLLLYIKKLLISYQTNLVIPDLGYNTETEFILENSKKIIELMNDIDDGNISNEILKHISSHLRFNGKLIEKVSE